MGSKGGSNQQIPKAPDPGQAYQSGIQMYLKYLPQELQTELANRYQYDPQFIEQALNMQGAYDPKLAWYQLEALKARDPAWYAMHQGLASKIQQGLDQGYLDPQQQAAYNQLMGLAGKVDPRQAAAYQQAGALAGQAAPYRSAEYKALAKQVTSDTLRGATADPETLRQMTQAIMAQRPNLSHGEAQDMATAVYVGQRGQALKQQRQAAGEQFLQQQTPLAQKQQSLAQFYGMPSPVQQQQQSLGQAYSMAPPIAQTLAQAGSFLQPQNSVTGQINAIQGVTPPSAMRYVNPNAGYQGQQFALQDYQNQLGYQQLQQQQGSQNPWTTALSAAGGIVGSIYGGPVGGAVGSYAGGAVGSYFSDVRLKINISRTGALTRDGIPIVEFEFKPPLGRGKRLRGVLAQDVMKVRPDAVVTLSGGILAIFYDMLGIKLEEVK